MRHVRNALLVVLLICALAVLLLLLTAGFVMGAVWLAGALGLQHDLGMDTQTSKQYASASGSLPIIVAALGFSSFFVGLWKHVNCEQDGCWRPGHRHPGHGRPVCRNHYHHDVVPTQT